MLNQPISKIFYYTEYIIKYRLKDWCTWKPLQLIENSLRQVQ